MNEIISPNRAILEAVAARIRPLLEEVVFVGGQVVELFITDPAAVRIRATADVDVVVSAGTLSEYHRIEERLRTLGFENDTSEGAPICRWVATDRQILDLMPVDETILGFSNRWYPVAVEQTEKYELRAKLIISVPRPAIFLATKLAAFQNRGRDDILMSHDLEDVIVLVAGRPELPLEVQDEREDVREWISAQIAGLLAMDEFSYALQGALPDAARMPGYREEVRTRFETIAVGA